MLYPSGINKEYKCNYGNRGISLENDINDSNEYYLLSNIAVVYKKPTPITINRVNYPNRKDAVITEAHFKTPSTTDYNGIYKGRYIDFEAKETKNKTSFPLNNIHKHQIEHLKRIIEHGGIGFLIVRFTSLNLTFYLDAKDLIKFVNDKKRKSIPISFFKEKGKIIKEGLRPRLNYLEYVLES